MADYSANLVIKVSQPTLNDIQQLEDRLKRISEKVNELTNKTFNPFAQQVTALRAVNRLLQSNLSLNNKYNTVLKATTQELERAAKATKKVEKGGALAGGVPGGGSVGAAGGGGRGGERLQTEERINRVLRERLEIANRAATIYELEAAKAQLQGPVWEKVKQAKEEIAKGANANLTYINTLLRSAAQLLQIEKKRNAEVNEISKQVAEEERAVQRLVDEKLRALRIQETEEKRIIREITAESERRIRNEIAAIKEKQRIEQQAIRDLERRSGADFKRGTGTLKELGTRVDRAFGGALSSIENIGVRGAVGGMGLMIAQGLAAADSMEVLGRSVFDLQGPIGEAIKMIGSMDQNLGLAAVAAMAFAPQIKNVAKGAVSLGQGAAEAGGRLNEWRRNLSSMEMPLDNITAGVKELNNELDRYRDSSLGSQGFRDFQTQTIPKVREQGEIDRAYNRSSAKKTADRQLKEADRELEGFLEYAARLRDRDAAAARQAAEATRQQAIALAELSAQFGALIPKVAEYQRLTESINAVTAAAANLERTRADYFGTTNRSMQEAIQKTREYTQVVNELNNASRRPAQVPALRPAGMTDAEVRRLNENNQFFNGPTQQFGPAVNPGTDRKPTRDALNRDAAAQQMRTSFAEMLNKVEMEIARSRNAALKATERQVAEAKTLRLENKLSQKAIDAQVKARKEEWGLVNRIGRQIRLNALRRERAGGSGAGKGIGKKMAGQGFGENLALGVGFPLLFGGGPGSILGSGIGSFFGKGFGGQILGGAVGQVFDQMVVKAGQLGNAILSAADSAEALREALVPVSGEIEFQAEQMKKLQGDVAGAGALMANELFAQTGDVGGEGAKGAAAAVNELEKAWNGVANAVNTTVGIIAAPFAMALAAVLRLVQAILFAVNSVVTVFGVLAKRAAENNPFLANLQELSIKGTAEYEKQQAELLRQQFTMEEQVKLLQKQNSLRENLSKSSSEEYKFALRLEKLDAMRTKQQQALRDLRAGFNGRTAEERARELKLEQTLTKQNALETQRYWLELQREATDQIRAWNKDVSRANMDLLRQEASERLRIARANADLELQASRKIADARLRLRELEAQAAMKGIDLAQEELKIRMEIAYIYEKAIANASFTPTLSGFVADLDAAIAKYEQGIINADQKAAARREVIAVRAERARLQLQRYLEDSDTRIARMNFDNAKKIEEINIRIQRRQEDFLRKSLKAQIEAQIKLTEKLGGIKLGAANYISEQIEEMQSPFYLDPVTGQFLPEEMKQARIEGLMKKLAEMNVEYMEAVTIVTELRKVLGELDVPLELKQFSMNDKFVGISDSLRQEMTEVDAALQKIEASMANNGEKNEGKQRELEFVRQYITLVEQQTDRTRGLVEQEQVRVAKLNEVRNLINNEGIYGEAARQLAELSVNQNIVNGFIDIALEKLQKFNDDPAVAELIKKLELIRDLSQEGARQRAEQIRQTTTVEYKVQTEGIDKAKEELTKLQDPANLIINSANAIGDAFGEAFKNIVSGSMSAQEAFANMTKKIADFFLDMAAKMLAEYVKLILMQTILNAIGGPKLGGSGNMGGDNYFSPITGKGVAGPNFGLASGGRALPGNSFVVGERGPEIFTPDSPGTVSSNRAFDAARDSMSMEADDAAASAAEQREEMFYETMQSAKTIDVNYDVNVINEVSYVTEEQFQRGMKETAKSARARTMDDLRNYPGKRARVGMR